MRRWRRTNIASAYIVLVLFVGSAWTQTTDDTATADFTDDTATDVPDGATDSGTMYEEMTSAVSIVDNDTSVTTADDYDGGTTAVMESENPSTSEQNVEDGTGTVDTSDETEPTATELPNNNETVSDTAMDTTTVISDTENSDVTESDNTTIEDDDDSFTTASSSDDSEDTTVGSTITPVSTDGDIPTTASDSQGTEQDTSATSLTTNDVDIEPTNAMSTEADDFGGATEENTPETTVPLENSVPTTTSNTDEGTEPTIETSTEAEDLVGTTEENTPETTVATDNDEPTTTSTADSGNTDQVTSTMSSTTDAVIEPTKKTSTEADENTATPETTVPTDGDIPTTASAADKDTSTMSSTTSVDIESTNAMSTTAESDVTIDNEVTTMSTTEGYNQTVATESSQTRSFTDPTGDIETTAASTYGMMTEDNQSGTMTSTDMDNQTGPVSTPADDIETSAATTTVMITEGNQPGTMTTTKSDNQTRSVTTPTDDIETTAASTTAMVTRGNQYETMASTGMDNQTRSVTDPTDDIETTSVTTTVMVTRGNQSGTMSSTGMDNQTRPVTNPTDDIQTTAAFTTVMITKSTGDVISTTDVSTATVVTPTTVLATTRITDLTGQSTIVASTATTTTTDITTSPMSTPERTTIAVSAPDMTTSTASTRDTATTTASAPDTATTTTITTSTPDTTTQSTAPQQNDICTLENIQVREADTIASPNYPQNYGGNRNCMIQLQNPDSCGRISITLERLRTEFPYDTLQIDGIEGVEGGEARLSGLVSRTTYYSTSDIVTIRFESSANTLGEQGFQLTYEPVTNECECSNPCGNHSMCSYSAGKTTCECDCGYSHVDMQDGSKPGSNCDLDECTIGTDDCDQICTNKVDDYSCSCDEGFTWNSDERKCEADFPYERSTCQGGIAYYDASQRVQCKCPKYYLEFWSTCVLAGIYFGTPVCSDGLRLLPVSPGFECTCPTGFSLSSVSNNKCCVKEQCTDDTCNGRGQCAESDAGPVCTCDNTSKGDRCQDQLTCADAECQFGKCVDLLQGGFECQCGNGYELSGTTCVDIDECKIYCMGEDKSCTNYEPGYTCRCADGYEPPRNHPNDGSICHEIVMLDIMGDEETVRTSRNFHRGVFSVPITYGTNVFSRFILQQDGVIILEKGPTRHRVYMPFIAYTDLPTIHERFTDLAVVCAFLGDYYWYYDRDTYVAQYDFQSDGGRTKLTTITNIVKNSNNSVQSDFNAIGALAVTWINRRARVSRGSNDFDKTDNFQMILATDGNVTYSVFNFRVGYMDARHYQRKDSPPLMGWTDTESAFTQTIKPHERPDLSSNVGKNGRWVFNIGAASRVWNPQCLAWNAEASEPESSNICPPTFRNAWRSGYRYLPSTPVWIITFRFFWGRFYLSFRYYHPLLDFDAIDELREFAPSHCLQRSRNAAYDGSNSICCYNNRRKRRLIEADYSPDNLLVAGQVVQSPVYGSDRSQAQRYLENDVRPRSWCCDDLNEETCSLYRNKRPAVTSAGYRFRGRFCQSRGEPLLSTLDGNDYLFSGLGEYILGMGNNTMMQGRLSQSTDVNGTLIEGSVLTAFAVGGNDTGVESLGFYLGGINGTSDLLNMTITLGRQRLDDESIELLTNGTGIDLGDLQIELANSSVQVSTKNSYTITITPTAKLLTVIISSQPDTFGDLKGLYGFYDGDSSNDFEMRNTTVLELDALRFNPYPSPADARQMRMNKYFTNETILEEKVFDFGQSWLVEESETLFTYGVGQSWSSMRNETFRPKSLPDLLEEASEEQLSLTDELCLKSGLYDLSCLRTFLITGDKSAAQNTLDAGDALEETKTDLNNVPPEWLVNITEILLEVGQEFVLQLEANDTGELTYGIEGSITDLKFNFSTTTGEFIFTPTDLTVFNVTFTVTDSGDLQRTLTPTVKICTCYNGGNCSYDSDPVNTTDRFQVHGCNCPEAWDGDFCSDDNDECQFNPCDGGNCTDIKAPGTGYNCTIECAEGEELIDNKCYLIDLCNETKPCEQICETSRGGYNCSCEAGYAVSAANDSRCEDVDECLTNTSCPAVNTFCENSVGNFSCVCDDGYTGNVSTGCVDIDECDTTAPCNATTQTCLNSPGSFSCSCKTGYTSDNGTCVNINECDNTAPCDNLTQTCSDTEGSYKCDCRDGYLAANGSSTCEDIDECAENRHNCPASASCSNEVGSFLCICGSGYNYNSTANECVDIDECADNNGACNFTCDNSDGSFKCSCDVGFRIASNGFGCVDIDECSDPAKCQQDCKNTPGNYSCSCYEGFVGDGDACQANATCTNTTSIDCVNADCYLNSTNEPNCLCKSGFEAVNGTHCEDIKECDTVDVCGADASCTEESPGYACSCNSRYVDVAGSNSKTVVTCRRVVAPTVVEPTGSNLGDDFAYITWTNGDLVDHTRIVLEQMEDAGTINGTVVNETVESTVTVYNFTSLIFRTQYRVSLYAIYNDVSGDQEQFNFTTTFTMYPPEILRGNVTTSTIELLLERPTNGPCPDISLSYRAEGSNVTGADSTEMDSTVLSALSPGITYKISAKCVDGDDVSEESVEISIQTDIDKCLSTGADSYCKNDGVCTKTGFNMAECNCTGTGYSGSTCEDDIDECAATADPCGDTGNCTNHAGSYNCTCAFGYTGGVGVPCTDIDECAATDDPCGDTGSCVNRIGTYNCTCSSGYEGGIDGPCDDTDECAATDDPCGVTGNCTNSVGSYNCTCSPGYEGGIGGPCNVAVTTTTEAPTTSMYQDITTEGTNVTTALNGTQTESTTQALNDTQTETATPALNGTQTEATTVPTNGTATTPASNETKTEATTQVLNATETDGTTTTLAPNATASSTTTLASNDTGTQAGTTAPAGTVQTEATTESQASSTTSTTEAATVAPSTTVQLETTTSSVTTAVATTTPEPAVEPAVVRVSVKVTFQLPCNSSLIADTSSAYYQNYLEIFRNVTFALFKFIGRPVNTLARVTLTCGSVVASGEAELPANTTASSNETQAEIQDAIANGNVSEIAENNVTSAEVTDVDECANSTDNNCDANADCADQDPGFQCSCKAGYWDRDPDNAGTKCEVQCEYGGSPYCMNSGNCTNGTGVGTPSCVCSSDYTGDRCETQVPTTKITTTAEETTSDPYALTPTAAATDALTATTTVPAGTDTDVGTPTSTEDTATTATDALAVTEAESTTADTDALTSTVPDSTGVATDALTATEAESTAAVTDSSTSSVPDSTGVVTDALTATEPESTAAVTDSSTSTVPDSTGIATDALTATEAESTAAVTDSSTSTVLDSTGIATDALTATEAESTAAVTDSSTSTVADSTDAATDALTAAGTDSTTADTDALTTTASDPTATDTDGLTPTASDPTATETDTLTPAVSEPTATEADTTAAGVGDETTAGATSDGTDVSTSTSSVEATSASDEATTSTIAATTTTLEPSTTTQTITTSATTATPETTTTPIATTAQETTTTLETTTTPLATTTLETTTTPESTTITQSTTTTPQPGTSPEPTTSQGPTAPSESTSISQSVSTQSASTTQSAAETQTTTTTPAPTTTPPRTDVTQMNFSMTLNQTCDQEVTNAGSQAYLQTLAIFREVVLALGNHSQVPVFGIAQMNFVCGSIIGSGVLQLPRNVTDNSTEVARKFASSIASGEVPEVEARSVQRVTVTDVNECSNGRNNCDESADCTDTDPGFTCQCRSGFRDLVPSDPGTSCEDQCFLSGADYCTNGATCVRQQGSQNPTCQCTDFYQGARCADRNGGAIAGLTIGLLALAALIVAAVAIVIHLRRKRKSHNFAAADVPAEARTRYDDVSTGSTRGRLDDVLQ